MNDPNRDPDVTYDPDENEIDTANKDNQPDDEDSSAVLDDASPDARNGAVGGTDGITKNQDDTAQ